MHVLMMAHECHEVVSVCKMASMTLWQCGAHLHLKTLAYRQPSASVLGRTSISQSAPSRRGSGMGSPSMVVQLELSRRPGACLYMLVRCQADQAAEKFPRTTSPRAALRVRNIDLQSSSCKTRQRWSLLLRFNYIPSCRDCQNDNPAKSLALSDRHAHQPSPKTCSWFCHTRCGSLEGLFRAAVGRSSKSPKGGAHILRKSRVHPDQCCLSFCTCVLEKVYTCCLAAMLLLVLFENRAGVHKTPASVSAGLSATVVRPCIAMVILLIATGKRSWSAERLPNKLAVLQHLPIVAARKHTLRRAGSLARNRRP